MCKLAAIESNFNPNAKARTSSARGLYQIIKSTEKALRKKYNIKGNIYDIKTNFTMAAYLVKEYMAKTGTKDYTALYLRHFLGPRQARILLDSEDFVIVRDILPKAYSANKGLIGDKTKLQFIKTIDELLDKARGCNE